MKLNFIKVDPVRRRVADYQKQISRSFLAYLDRLIAEEIESLCKSSRVKRLSGPEAEALKTLKKL